MKRAQNWNEANCTFMMIKHLIKVDHFRRKVVFISVENLLGLTEYASFFTKFENRTANMMTGNPTNWTGNSNKGGWSCARTAFSLKSIMVNINADNSVRDGNITWSRIFFFEFTNLFYFTVMTHEIPTVKRQKRKHIPNNYQSFYSNLKLNQKFN